MMKFEIFLVTAVILIGLLQHVASEPDFVEDEDGFSLKGRHKWTRCRQSSDCKVGYYCRGRWCYPKRSCNLNAHCPANEICDTSDNVCKPGQRVCKSHQECGHYMYCKNGACAKKECHHYRRCRYGYECVNPGVCKRIISCNDQSDCGSDQCCVKKYGNRYRGQCKNHVRPADWCDLRGKWTCQCVKGYTCTRHGWGWGKCTPEPTDEPGSGDVESF